MDMKDKIKSLDGVIALSTVYSSLEAFVGALKEIRESMLAKEGRKDLKRLRHEN